MILTDNENLVEEYYSAASRKFANGKWITYHVPRSTRLAMILADADKKHPTQILSSNTIVVTPNLPGPLKDDVIRVMTSTEIIGINPFDTFPLGGAIMRPH